MPAGISSPAIIPFGDQEDRMKSENHLRILLTGKPTNAIIMTKMSKSLILNTVELRARRKPTSSPIRMVG
jgi:hypothetical protein